MLIKFNAKLSEKELEDLVDLVVKTTKSTSVSVYNDAKNAIACEVAETAINKIIEDEDIFINEDTLFSVTDETAFTLSVDRTSLEEFEELAHDVAMDTLKAKKVLAVV